MKLAVCSIVCVLLASAAYATSSFELSNGYYRVSGDDGIIKSMRLDPSGQGNYDKSRIISFRVGDPMPSPAASVVSGPGTEKMLTIEKAKLSVPTKLEQLEGHTPEMLETGGTIAQTIEFEHGYLQHVEAKIPTWGTSDSSVAMTVYRIDGDKKSAVARTRLTNLKDNAFTGFSFPDQPAGKYMIELSEPKGKVGWWSQGADLIEGEAFTNGTANPTMDRAIVATGYNVVIGNYEISLNAAKLKVKFTPADTTTDLQLQAVLTIPWIKSGYDTTSDKIVFDHFLTSSGLYVPVHQLKRRPHSGVGGDWVIMSGRFGSDLKFTNAPIHLSMEEDSMSLSIPGAEREIELLHHSAKISDEIPS